MINVLRLPGKLNIDDHMGEKILEVYGTCPYCQSDNLYSYSSIFNPYSKIGTVSYQEIKEGKLRPIGGKGLFKKVYNWKHIKFNCHKCGMIWTSPSYPVVGDDIDANNAIFHAWQEGKNMEVNTLLLTVINEKEK